MTGGGMSRASKKRAKRKKKVPVEKVDESVPSNANAKTLPEDPSPQKKQCVGGQALPREHSENVQTSDSRELRDQRSVRPSKLIDLLHIQSDSSFADLSAKERARLALEFLFLPSEVKPAEFYDSYWEKEPLCAQRNSKLHRCRFDGILSKESIKATVQQHTHYYGRDLNVTRYQQQLDGIRRRQTLDLSAASNSSGEDGLVPVDAEQLWSNFDRGCTIRLLCPHKHSRMTHSLLSLMESEWSCMVGANAYLTPPDGSQGFAPHYDDIEAFCLQLEGKKRWKVYAPIHKSNRLPRSSSKDFTESDLVDVEPFLDVVLEPGDVLYMPRGWIHQACTVPGDTSKHSLHLTVSAMQQWAWIDLMEILIPEAMESAATGDSTMLRQGLPREFLDYMGGMHDQSSDPQVLLAKENADAEHGIDNCDEVEEEEDDHLKRRLQRSKSEAFRTEAKRKIMKIAKEALDLVDAACDELGKRYLSDRLPPVLTEAEKEMSIQSEKVEILPQTLCRMTRPGAARLVVEDGKAVLYHCADNSMIYREIPLSPMEFELDDAPAIEQLLTTNENDWVRVADLIHDSIEDKVGVAQAIYDEGILCVKTQSL